MDTIKLFDRIVKTVKAKGVYDEKSKFRDEWNLTLDNGMTIKVYLEDGGYTDGIFVKGFLSAFHTYKKDVEYFTNRGDDNALLTIAKMLGVDKEPTLHDLVIEYHDCNCKWNHTDGCAWMYEMDRGVHNWNGWTHKQWMEKYLTEVRPLTPA